MTNRDGTNFVSITPIIKLCYRHLETKKKTHKNYEMAKTLSGTCASKVFLTIYKTKNPMK